MGNKWELVVAHPQLQGGYSSTVFRSKWNLEVLVFEETGENRSTRRKTSRSMDKNQEQTQPTSDIVAGNRTRPQC